MFQFLIFAPATGLFILEDERGYNRDHRHFSKILMKCGQSYLNTEGLICAAVNKLSPTT